MYKNTVIFIIFILFLYINAQAETYISAYIPKWTVMLYATPSPDLEDDLVGNIIELTKVGGGWDLNIVIQIDWSKYKDISDEKKEYFPDPYYTGVSRYSINSRGRIELIEHLGEKNMGDINTLWEFLDYCRYYEEGRRYILIFSGHGSGFESYNDLNIPLNNKNIESVDKIATINEYKRQNNRSIAYDDKEGDSLTIHELKKALDLFKKKTKKKIEILVFDSCLLASLETLYELKDSVRYVVGSEAGVLTKGVDYSMIVKPLKENPDISSVSEINKMCYAFVGGDSWSATLANMFGGAISIGIDMSKIEDIKNSLDRLLIELFKVKTRPLKFYDLMGFGKVKRYFDITRWCYRIMMRYVNFSSDPNYRNVAIAARRLINSIESATISLWTAGKYNRQLLGGISLWWPQTDWYIKYKYQHDKTALVKNSLWGKFLDMFLLDIRPD